MKRRTFIQGVVGAGLSSLLAENALAAKNKPLLRFLRPPGALPEDEFISRCIRCGKCGETCPNRCIQYFDLENGISSSDTPYIIPREQACILCMKCGDICPTGAIQPVKREMEPILEKVKMGIARLIEIYVCLGKEKHVVFVIVLVH